MQTIIWIGKSVSFSSITEAKTSKKDNALKRDDFFFSDFNLKPGIYSARDTIKLPFCTGEEGHSCLKTKVLKLCISFWSRVRYCIKSDLR